MKRGTILHGRVKVVHDGEHFQATLPDKVLTTEQYVEGIQAHFWRGFFYALDATSEVDREGYSLNTSQDSADFHFAIALAYYRRAVTPV